MKQPSVKLTLISKMLFMLLSCCIASCFRPTAMMIQHDQNSKWVRDSSLHFQYYMEANLWSKERGDSIKLAMEKNFSEVLRKISKDTNYPSEPIHYFIVSGYEEMNRLKHINSNNYSLSHWRHWIDTSGLAHDGEHYIITTFKQMNTNTSYSREKGLIGIVTANKLWNICNGDLDDAIGIFIHDSFEGYDLHEFAAYLYRKNYRFIVFDTRPQYAFSEWILSPLYASLMRFSVQKYGVNILQCWCNFDYDQFSFNVCPYDAFAIIAEWEQMLKNRNSPQLDTIRYRLEP